jgi:hypothetical protein
MGKSTVFLPESKYSYNIHDNIIIFCFINLVELNVYLGRPCAFYEKKKFNHGMVGINFPIRDFNEWATSVNGEFSPHEKELCNLIQSFRFKIVYLVAYVKGDHSTFKHEMAHALFALVPSYNEKIEKLWHQMNDNERIYVEKDLIAKGYDKKYILDEWHAYLLESPKSLGKKYSQRFIAYHETIKNIFNEFHKI